MLSWDRKESEGPYIHTSCSTHTQPPGARPPTVATSTPSQLRPLARSVSTTDPTVAAGARAYPAMYCRACMDVGGWVVCVTEACTPAAEQQLLTGRH